MPQNNDWKFQECDSCIVKPGSPDLCNGCIHNRKAISQLQSQLDAQKVQILDSLPKMLLESQKAEDKAKFLELIEKEFIVYCSHGKEERRPCSCKIHNQALEDIKLKIRDL